MAGGVHSGYVGDTVEKEPGVVESGVVDPGFLTQVLLTEFHATSPEMLQGIEPRGTGMDLLSVDGFHIRYIKKLMLSTLR
jgi:hypothetical protein